jgi:hypothetical protein
MIQSGLRPLGLNRESVQFSDKRQERIYWRFLIVGLGPFRVFAGTFKCWLILEEICSRLPARLF